MRLSGAEHEVVTGVHLYDGDAGERSLCVTTRVRFRSFDAASAERYVASGEGRDKAGSYAIQGLGSGLVESIQGSYSNVVGLPATQTLEMLLGAGVVESWP